MLQESFLFLSTRVYVLLLNIFLVHLMPLLRCSSIQYMLPYIHIQHTNLWLLIFLKPTLHSQFLISMQYVSNTNIFILFLLLYQILFLTATLCRVANNHSHKPNLYTTPFPNIFLVLNSTIIQYEYSIKSSEIIFQHLLLD